MPLTRGLYETLVTEALQKDLLQLRDGARLEPLRDVLAPEDAPERIGMHIGRVVRRALEGVGDSQERVRLAGDVTRAVLAAVHAKVPSSDALEDAIVVDEPLLRAVRSYLPSGEPERIRAPLIPLLDTTLLSNAPGEPRLQHQIAAEIESADQVDVVMAFIRWSGIRAFLDALRRHCETGRSLRILTTTYTGSTEARALDALQQLGAELRVSYDTTMTRLHAKAWLFQRRSGYSTAYVGSSNLTHSAQVSGLEWNVRISGARNPTVTERVAGVFESYWESGDFVPYDREDFLTATSVERRHEEAYVLTQAEIRLEPFQERLLEQVDLSRKRGRHANLLVSATGTGKTVMAAVDFARLRKKLPRSRMLFVAHREEILKQSRATFRHALRDGSFGELWVAGKRPDRFEHVFASIQSLAASGLDHVDPEHFDVVIVDEFHHAAAPTYTKLLERLKPKELLGLTATPERSDGLSLLRWFDDRIAAELRLWDAIDQHRLTPFAYFGVHDGLDLRDIPWKRGRGYDVDGLTNVLTADDIWARRVIEQVTKRIGDIGAMRAPGFCVSVKHARFMARVFSNVGIRSVAVSAETDREDRARALRDLESRAVNAVFSVDIFNEGVDLPSVDTLLFLRPTDSAMLFLQQLGRGLRRSHDKDLCTVLDFVGHHRREFRVDRKLRALLGGTRKELTEQVEQGFPFLPAGCHMELDSVAQEIVLANIQSALPTTTRAKAAELAAIAGGETCTLARYLDETGLELEDVYRGTTSWSDLCEAAGLVVAPSGTHENLLRRAVGRLLHVDDDERLGTYRELLSREAPPEMASLGEREARTLRMLIASLSGRGVDKSLSLAGGVALLWEHPQVRAELLQLLEVLVERVDHVHPAMEILPHVPLQVFARYSRIEILAAMGVGQTATTERWQTGVRFVEDARTDLLAFTLDKSTRGFSPTTRYRDYAISRQLIHWESQSSTRAGLTLGDTGYRYRNHERLGSHILLFARLNARQRAFWFLGPATYVRHEGERPMAITWRLHHKLPGDLFAQLATAVA